MKISYQINIILILCIMFVFSGCGNNAKVGNGAGKLALAIKNTVDFDPDIEHSKIDHFIVTIEGDGVAHEIKQKFGYDTGAVTFEGFEVGKSISVTVEAVNDNGYAILRGKADEVYINPGNTNVSTIEIKAVPVFANVYHNATVYANRFIPKVYAPTGIEFEVSSLFKATETVLEDVISGEINFSINKNDTEAVKAIYIQPLNAGTQQLTVRDIDTDESTTITINTLNNGLVKALPTTAGAYVGSLMSAEVFNQPNSLEHYFRQLLTQ
jgi:hypothetical protein